MLIAAGVVVAALIIGGVVYVTAGTAPASGTAAAGASRSPSAPASPVPSSTPPAALTLNDLLTAQSAALLAGNEAGWLALVKPSEKNTVAVYRRLYDGLRALQVRRLSQVVADDTGYDTLGSWNVGDDRPADVTVTFCAFVDSCSDQHAMLHVHVTVTTSAAGPHALIDGIDSQFTDRSSTHSMAPWPWQVADLHSVVGRRVILASSATYASRLPALLPAAERAAERADTLAIGDKPPVYIVYLATAAEYKRWFTIKHTASEAGVAVTLGSNDIEVLIRMPDADQTRLVGAGGVAAVIGHEFGHVATLQEKSTKIDSAAAMFSGGDDDLVEGIAEYCSYTGHPASWSAARLANVRTYIRSGKWSGDAFLSREVTSSDGLTASAAYGIGYLTIRRLVQRFGLERTLEFWEQTENLPYAIPDQASQAVFHASWTSVNADLAHYIRQTVHA